MEEQLGGFSQCSGQVGIVLISQASWFQLKINKRMGGWVIGTESWQEKSIWKLAPPLHSGASTHPIVRHHCYKSKPHIKPFESIVWASSDLASMLYRTLMRRAQKHCLGFKRANSVCCQLTAWHRQTLYFTVFYTLHCAVQALAKIIVFF